MNRFCKYENIDLWDEAKWQSKTSSIYELVRWLTKQEHPCVPNRVETIDDSLWRGYENPKDYHSKTGSMNVPAVIEKWKNLGFHYEDRELGHVRWIVMAAKEALENPQKKLPALMVLEKTDYTNPYWAMEMLEHYQAYSEMARREQMMLLYVAMEQVDENMMYSNILMEATSIFPADPKRLYLDLSPLYGSGHKLSDIKEFTLKTPGGENVTDPDSKVEHMGSLKLPVLNISGLWANNKTNNFFQITQCGNATYNKERLLYSEMGKKLAEGMYFEYMYDRLEDDGLQEYLEKNGLICKNHDRAGSRWTFLAPESAGKDGEKLPMVCIFQEVNYSNDHLIPAALGIYLEYVKLAAFGELCVLFFAAEHPDDNDLLCEMIKDASELYPVDPDRVYVTGHSHNGHFTREFAYRHPDVVAAAAPLGNFPGLPKPEESGEAVLVPDEKIEAMSKIDMPLINFSGYSECGCMYPLNQAADHLLPGQEFMCPLSFESRAGSWQRRLRASGCPVKTLDEIGATAKSEDLVTRKLGIPCDKSEVLFIDGFEHYVADIRNTAGKYHLRMVGIENMPHMPLPSMVGLSWSFMRRFARNRKTLEVVERY